MNLSSHLPTSSGLKAPKLKNTPNRGHPYMRKGEKELKYLPQNPSYTYDHSWKELFPVSLQADYLHSTTNEYIMRYDIKCIDSRTLLLALRRTFEVWKKMPTVYESMMIELERAAQQFEIKNIHGVIVRKLCPASHETLDAYYADLQEEHWIRRVLEMRHLSFDTYVLLPKEVDEQECVQLLADLILRVNNGVKTGVNGDNVHLTLVPDMIKSDYMCTFICRRFEEIMELQDTNTNSLTTQRVFYHTFFTWLARFGFSACKLATKMMFENRQMDKPVEWELPQSLTKLESVVNHCPETNILYYMLLQMANTSVDVQVDFELVITTSKMYDALCNFFYEILVKKYNVPGNSKHPTAYKTATFQIPVGVMMLVYKHLSLSTRAVYTTAGTSQKNLCQSWKFWCEKIGDAAKKDACTMFQNTYFPDQIMGSSSI